MLGFAPISTYPVSTIEEVAPVTPSAATVTTGADAGEGRRLTKHERRRRRIHADQMRQWRVQFEALLADAEDVPEVRAAAATIAEAIERVDDPAALARRSFAQWFAPDAALRQAIVLPTDRGDIDRDVQQRRQVADIARRLREVVEDARVVRAQAAAAARIAQDEADEEDDIAVLLMLL